MLGSHADGYERHDHHSSLEDSMEPINENSDLYSTALYCSTEKDKAFCSLT